ncbi:MAG: hypothetical protein ACXABY_23675 [Candidatus Thorarchaeota archaeon]|jgi:hypothetical protein
MTNNDNLQLIAEKIEEQAKSLRELRFLPQGVALIELLEELHDIVLTGLVNVPGDQIHRVSEYQGKYKVIHLLLQRITEDEDASDESR